MRVRRAGPPLGSGGGCMKQSDIDMIAEARIRRVKRFSMWMWLFLFPALGVVLYLNFSSGEQPAVHRQPPAFSCASQRADDAVLGDGGGIAPLCGETPYADAPETDEGSDGGG
jgi:hypothetical protein